MVFLYGPTAKIAAPSLFSGLTCSLLTPSNDAFHTPFFTRHLCVKLPKTGNPAVKIKFADFPLFDRRMAGTLFLSCTAALVSGCAGVKTVAPQLAQLNIPEPIRVPNGQEVVLDAQGRGSLLYECQAIKRTPFQYSWLLQSPGLKLEDSRGQTVTYYPGTRSRWVHSDGSSVTSRERVEVAVSNQNMPLMRAAAEASTGSGALTNVSYIQTLRTVGGVVAAPACTASSLGMRVVVPYESDFVFWRPTS